MQHATLRGSDSAREAGDGEYVSGRELIPFSFGQGAATWQPVNSPDDGLLSDRGRKGPAPADSKFPLC